MICIINVYVYDMYNKFIHSNKYKNSTIFTTYK